MITKEQVIEDIQTEITRVRSMEKYHKSSPHVALNCTIALSNLYIALATVSTSPINSTQPITSNQEPTDNE